ncbi:glycosyltransferase, partial [filamentous cyanobacterium CCP1]
VTEGFGLQPMEALACGCQVFSSVNGGLSDYLDPGFNCYKIAGYSKAYDVQRILRALESPNVEPLPESFFAEYRTENILQRLNVILNDLNQFFDFKQEQDKPIEPLTKMRLTRLKMKRNWNKLKKRLG